MWNLSASQKSTNYYFNATFCLCFYFLWRWLFGMELFFVVVVVGGGVVVYFVNWNWIASAFSTGRSQAVSVHRTKILPKFPCLNWSWNSIELNQFDSRVRFPLVVPERVQCMASSSEFLSDNNDNINNNNYYLNKKKGTDVSIFCRAMFYFVEKSSEVSLLEWIESSCIFHWSPGSSLGAGLCCCLALLLFLEFYCWTPRLGKREEEAPV